MPQPAQRNQDLSQFYEYLSLPKKIRDEISNLHDQERSIRHYFSQLQPQGAPSRSRYYVAIDLKANCMARRTQIGQKLREALWKEDGTPRMEDADGLIRVKRETWSLYGFSIYPTSIVTVLKRRSVWRTRTVGKYLYMNYDLDMVVLDGIHTCLQPLVLLTKSRISWRDLKPTWFWKVQLLALHIQGCRDNIEKTIAALPDIRHVYLLVHRDPECTRGAPREWIGFDPEKHMNEHKFMHVQDFVLFHPRKSVTLCECETDLSRANEVENNFRRAFLAEHKSHVQITVVADPY